MSASANVAARGRGRGRDAGEGGSEAARGSISKHKHRGQTQWLRPPGIRSPHAHTRRHTGERAGKREKLSNRQMQMPGHLSLSPTTAPSLLYISISLAPIRERKRAGPPRPMLALTHMLGRWPLTVVPTHTQAHTHGHTRVMSDRLGNAISENKYGTTTKVCVYPAKRKTDKRQTENIKPK